MKQLNRQNVNACRLAQDQEMPGEGGGGEGGGKWREDLMVPYAPAEAKSLDDIALLWADARYKLTLVRE